ncbi:MAG: glycosyltransferase family 39 protein [Planctomycetes bacterium]|nr:glycosyltransferase family 39 protein [Planctomycetota bacterium]
MNRTRTHAAIVALFALLVFLPGSWSSGLSMSEGHRAIPAWEMLGHGDWLVPRMFEQPYMRKPPGMVWAIAASSSLFGATEFAARFVSIASSVGAAVLCCTTARRWFGGSAGLVAGVAFVLTPWFWEPARSAEIEALHNFFTLAACLLSIEVLLGVRRGVPAAAMLALWIAAMIFAKGPAGMPCVVAAALGPCLARRNWRLLRRPELWVAIVIALSLASIYAFLAWRRLQEIGTPAIIEPPTRFLWKHDAIAKIAALPFVVIAAALPHSAALFMIPTLPGVDPRRDERGRAIAWTCALSIVLYTILGVSNNRYAMPAATLLPICVAFVHVRVYQGIAPSRLALPRARRAAIIGALCLTVAALAVSAWVERRRGEVTSGRAAGLALGELLKGPAELWADEMIDQRPEVLWYARERAVARGQPIRVRWIPWSTGRASPPAPALPPSGSYLVLRHDPPPRDLSRSELALFQDAKLIKNSQIALFSGSAHNFTFSCYQSPVIPN